MIQNDMYYGLLLAQYERMIWTVSSGLNVYKDIYIEIDTLLKQTVRDTHQDNLLKEPGIQNIENRRVILDEK